MQTDISVFTYVDSQRREAFLEGLSTRSGISHHIKRADMPAAVIALYKENLQNILLENAFNVRFVGEKGFDAGGLVVTCFQLSLTKSIGCILMELIC